MSGTTPPRPATARGGLGGPLIAFIVFDVLLVVAAVWLAVSLATGPDGSEAATQDTTSSSPAAQPSSEATAPADEPSEEPSEAAEVEKIASPSGNIACDVSVEGARCAIAELAAEPAPVEGCEGTVGYVVEVTDAGVDVPCVTSDEPQLSAGGEPAVLEYGQETAVGDFVCASSEAGMTCTSSGTGQGFTLARAGVTEVG